MEDLLLVFQCRRGGVEAMARIYRKSRKDLLNSHHKDYDGALAVTRWLIAQAGSAGWTYYVHRWLIPMEQAFAAGEGYRTGLFMQGPDAFSEAHRYARRLLSLQGPARHRATLLPLHLRHLKGW